MKKLFILLILVSLSCSSAPVKDSEVSAIEGGDFTALIEGCGNQIISGYTYCRKTEGDASNEILYFLGPITNCKRDFCVEFKVYNQEGEIAYGDAIPKNKNRISIPWSKLLKRDTFEISDRGFWIYIYRVYWLDENGNENVSIAEGEIRLRVLKKNYVPLHEVVKDKNFEPKWGFWSRDGQLIRMTTGMRTYVSRRP